MRFAHPWFFLLLLLVPAYIWWQMVKRRAALVFSDLGFLRGATPRGRYGRIIVHALYALALVFMTVALARPQRGRQFQEVETRGIDIMLCLDISGSMRAEDFAPQNRLTESLQTLPSQAQVHRAADMCDACMPQVQQVFCGDAT